jgi:nitrous oxidase accessory protein NosD
MGIPHNPGYRIERRKIMKMRKLNHLVGALFAVGLFLVLPAGTSAAKHVVGNCKPGGFATIGAAVAASHPGDQIEVCPGTYQEQVTITIPLTINGDNGAVITSPPTGVTTNVFREFNNTPFAALIVVVGTTGVTLNNLTIDGTGNALSDCSTALTGIYYQNASGQIEEASVRSLLVSDPTCVTVGIVVDSGSGGRSSVEIEDTSVRDYQAGGILADLTGTNVEIQKTVVTGTLGLPRFEIGIQISRGAKASVQSSTVSSNSSTNPFFEPSSGIVIANCDGVQLLNNTVGTDQGGIAIFHSPTATSNQNLVAGNTIYATTDAEDGVYVQGDQNKVLNNTISASTFAGVEFLGNNNVITGNTINDAPVGLLQDAGSLNNFFGGNRFFNTPTPVIDPAPRAKSLVTPL